MPAVEGWHWRTVREVASALLLVLAAAYVMARLALQHATDDGIFLQALDQQGIIEFLVSRYHDWSGRTLVDGLLVATIGFPLAWKLGVPAAWLGSAWCIWRLALAGRLPMLSGTALVLLMASLVHVMVRAETVYWVTGFYNYLLPVFLALVAMVVLHAHGAQRGMRYLVALPAIVFACQAEQVAMVLLAVLAARIALRLRQGEGVRDDMILLAAGAAAAVVAWMAPGNAIRMESELRWFPEYADAGLLAKVGMGLDRLNAHAQSPRNLLLLAVAGLSAWATLRSSSSATARIVGVILVLYIVSALVAVSLRLAGIDGWPRMGGVAVHLSPQEWLGGGIFVSMGFTICVYGALVTGAACRARDLRELVSGAGIPLLAVASTMLVALSPTIYASGFRILFVGDMLLLVHGAMLVSWLLDPGKRRQASMVPPGATA